ncbi:MAG: SDR family NAD(P)-dependent oxidoreductase [Hyphomicrobiaceae bacterium]
MREGQIIVTGASRGIGAAIASDLTSRGFSVAALSRSGTSPVGRSLSCDVTSESSIVDAFRAVASHGPILGLVNNAGAHEAKASNELSAAEFEATLRLNATSVLIGAREAYPHLMAARGGLIVNIGSFFDKFGVPGSLAYCASKAAVGAITRCLAAEWAKDNIRVINVAPGYIETDLNRDFLARDKTRDWMAKRVPLGRAGQVEEVARLVGALFSEDIGYLTGETIYLDGGQGINH